MAFYNNHKYELPPSMRHLLEHQKESLRTVYQNDELITLSHLEFITASTELFEFTTYYLFIGIADTGDDTIMIIYGEYSYRRDFGPFEHGSFNYIQVCKSEMIEFGDQPSNEFGDQPSNEFGDQPSNFILQVGKNLCAIVLKSELIVIGIKPEFLENLDDPDDDVYIEPFLFITHIKYERKIIDFPFDSPSFDEKIISSVKKDDDGGCEIGLCFTCVCRSSEIIHSETMNRITISFSDEQIRITYVMNTTTYVSYVSDGEYNDEPTISTQERHNLFNRETTIIFFPEEDD
jgi:hypothetical protein